MVQVEVLLWACLVLLVVANLTNGIGVNWGAQTTNYIVPSAVVSMLLENGIDKVKLSDANPAVVASLAGTGIEVMVSLQNAELPKFNGKAENAREWVRQYVAKPVKEGSVNIKYVSVGNDPFSKRFNNNTFIQNALPALEGIQKALNEAGVGDKIKATIPFDAEVCKSETKGPSGGVFRPDIKDLMVQIVHFLNNNNSPFFLNMSPFLSVYENPVSFLNFSFFDGNASAITDNKTTYTNAFDVVYDTVVSALSKAGVPDLKLVVAEIGWPTDGDINANVKNAKRFYDGLVKKVSGNKAGTPLRPGTIDAYAYTILDENNRSIARGPFEKHWGLFTYDGKPKFSFDFTGKGREPEAIKGVVFMPSRWCVVNNETKDRKDLEEKFKLACSKSDCTSLGYGSSCNNLDFQGNVSYAFNMFYQMHGQNLCTEKLGGVVVLDDPSKGECVFPITNIGNA
ncbi:glucan endo-1,3-beta-glucosidase 8-like [Cornus florida]|uniref:glucan endo-1,3-beta-glucosidase 8-like n=1 Tax=Cornus florida TaxID=4283 RepID=UPI00289B13A3|nr:glucan endo-1,3-beta-glucosidase 8-like [Cornus florida]